MARRTETGPPRSGPNQACRLDAEFDRYVVPELSALRARARGLTGASHDADDLVQQTLLRAYGAIGRFDGWHPRAWLFTIMRHAWINEKRRRIPVPLDNVELIAIGSSQMSTWGVPEEVVTTSVIDPDLQAALDHLPRYYRAVIEAVTMRGQSCRETAAALAIPVGTVLSRLHRARAALREELSTSRPAMIAAVPAASTRPRHASARSNATTSGAA